MSMLKDFPPTFLIIETLGVWSDLSSIVFNTPSGESIIYPPPNRKLLPHDPSIEECHTILRTFQNEKAIKILHEYWGKYFPLRYVIEVIEPRFSQLQSEILDLYESKTSVASDKLEANPSPAKFLANHRLIFHPDDGIAEYRGAEYQFKVKGKARALLTFLHNSKNTPFPIDDIKTKCNPLIGNERNHCKGDKDIRDAVNYIRKRLKVNEGEFFPIEKRKNNWIWLEK